MAAAVTIEVRSELAAPAAAVWSHASSMAGVNAELSPWLRMTHPAGVDRLDDAPELRRGVAFHSWLLAFGVLPFDRHALGLVDVVELADGGGSFIEESTSWLQRRWRHERDVRPVPGGGCSVRDRLVIEPRLAPARPVIRRVVPWLFARRHRVLRRRFG